MVDSVARLRAALADRYTIERELGRGGMATVYLASDVKHRRTVAIKVLRPELASLLGPDRFLREVEIAARLNHPRDVLRQLEELSRQRFVSPYHMAIVYAGLDEQDSALDWLERAYEARSGPVYSVKGSFLFTSLRAHPRFTALLKKLNLV